MLVTLFLSAPALATLTIDDCGSDDAPNEYWSNYCNGACSYNSATDTLTCDMLNVDADDRYAIAFAVTTFGTSTYDYSVFGMVDNTRFCCAIDEDATDKVLTLELKGTETCDWLNLSWDDGSGGSPEENLEPASGQFLGGHVYGRDSGAGNGQPNFNCQTQDYIFGSDYVGSDYRDKLFGEKGVDEIHGLGDRDFIDAGPGDDYVEGDMGNDVIVGGCGADTLKGEAGNDTICDTNGVNLIAIPECSCNSNYDDLMDGGDGKDSLWYADTPTCGSGALDIASTCGAHEEDIFGDTTHWSQPTACEVFSSVPADCSFP
jgi:hypothetical protein